MVEITVVLSLEELKGDYMKALNISESVLDSEIKERLEKEYLFNSEVASFLVGSYYLDSAPLRVIDRILFKRNIASKESFYNGSSVVFLSDGTGDLGISLSYVFDCEDIDSSITEEVRSCFASAVNTKAVKSISIQGFEN